MHKNSVAKKLLSLSDKFEKLKSYTTSDKTSTDKDDWYNYVSKKDFFAMLDEGHFFESTMYAGHGYGSKKEDVEKIINSGKIVLAAMDICGAMSLKTNFKNSIEHCKTLNIAQNGAFENCMHNYIYRKSETDYDILTKISDYCERTTNTEYDRRECIDFKVKN